MPKSTHSERPWYEAWFDSPYYHLLYHERDESEAIQFLTGLFRLPAAANGNISSKTEAGNFQYTDNSNKVTEIENPNGLISSSSQDITYTHFAKTESITEGDNQLSFVYGPDNQRRKTVLTNLGNTVKTIVFSGNYEKITIGSDVYEVHYIPAGGGLTCIDVRHNGADAVYYAYSDHLGSPLAITDANGTVIFRQSFDAWGRKRNPIDWTFTTNTFTQPPWLIRGFTGHEQLDEFELINMNGRVYDPLLGRMNNPDNFVQAPAFSQSFNGYSYVWNNPLKFNDPSGEFIFTTLAVATGQLELLPAAIGADIGMWEGGTLANGTPNPLKWDYTSGKTWAYIGAGAAVGGLSGYVGGEIGASGIPFASTLSLAYSSSLSSALTCVYTGGQTDISTSFGVGCYDFNKGDFGYLGKEGNSRLENYGFALGALTSVSDFVECYSQWNLAHRDASNTAENSFKGSWYKNYLGPNGKENPADRLAQGIIPANDLDWRCYFHDQSYYDNGVNGVMGALFNKKLMEDDLILAKGALISSRLKSVSQAWAIGTSCAFYGIYGLKTAMSYSYLYPWLPQK